MKKILILSLFSISFIATRAQQLHVDWTRFIGGVGNCGTDIRYAIPTADKGILFVGATDCDSSGNIPPVIPDTLVVTARTNLLIGKLDSNNRLLWIKSFQGNVQDFVFRACQTRGGGYGILSYRHINVDDVWVMRLDSQGNKLWSKMYGSPTSDEQPTSITSTPDNGFIIMGSSNGSGGDIPSHYTTSQFVYDWFVIKTDSAGNKQWARSLGGSEDEPALQGGILVAPDGYYLAGTTSSTDHECVDTSWHINTGSLNDNFALLKLDTSGNWQWTKMYGGSSDDVMEWATWDSRDSTIMMVGYSYSSDGMVDTNRGMKDMLVVKAGMVFDVKAAFITS